MADGRGQFGSITEFRGLQGVVARPGVIGGFEGRGELREQTRTQGCGPRLRPWQQRLGAVDGVVAPGVLEFEQGDFRCIGQALRQRRDAGVVVVGRGFDPVVFLVGEVRDELATLDCEGGILGRQSLSRVELGERIAVSDGLAPLHARVGLVRRRHLRRPLGPGCEHSPRPAQRHHRPRPRTIHPHSATPQSPYRRDLTQAFQFAYARSAQPDYPRDSPTQDDRMRCPHCPDTALLMTDRQGIEIDYCPTCRGVWLDRGELDKLIERASTVAAAPAQQQQMPPMQQPQYGHQKPYYKHKKSWLSEIFD